MTTASIDTIPDAITGSNPVLTPGVVTTGHVTYGSEDIDIYRLDLAAGQAYLLTADKLGNWWHRGFLILTPAGAAEPVEAIHFYPSGPGYYDSESHFFFSYEVDTTLYLQVRGQYRLTAQYSLLLFEADVAAHTAGNDLLVWDNAHDIYDGGAGQDRLSFAHFANPVTVELYYGLITGADILAPSSRVNIRNVEIIEGTAGNDRLIGDYFQPGYDGAGTVAHEALLQEMTWRGGDGDDTLGSTSGATVFDGGAGSDTADYSGAAEGSSASYIRISLRDGTAHGGDAAGDRLISIENLIGGAGDDLLTGDHGANRLQGGQGFDTLVGLGGDDTLDGGEIPPYSRHVAQLSRAIFSFDRSEYAITPELDSKGQISAVVNHVGGDRSEGRDTVTNIAWLEFADQSLLVGELLDVHPGVAGPGVPVVALGETATVRGDYPGDRDLVAIDLQAGALYRFASLSGGAFQGDGLVIRSETGVVADLFGRSPTGRGLVDHEAVTFRAPLTGRYYVEYPAEFVVDDEYSGRGHTVSDDYQFRIDRIADPATATAGNDTLLATAAADFVDGLSGQDSFVYNRFPDGLTPRQTVWAIYESATAGALPSVYLTETTGTNAAGRYETVRHDIRVTGVERFVGSNVVDYFFALSEEGFGHGEGLAFEGRGGNDWFGNTLGADQFDGGEGNDAVTYATALQQGGVQIDLIAGTGRGGGAEGDRFLSIETIIGSRHADLLIGNDQTTLLSGDGGNDWITAGASGHRIFGDAGTDMASFIALGDIAGRAATEFRLVITPFSAHDGRAGGEVWQLSGIENLTGTVFNDLIQGDAAANLLRGGGGYDWFLATAGGDSIDGGTGADMISFIGWQNTAANTAGDPFGPLPPGGAQATGVVVDLRDMAHSSHLAAGLNLTSVERVTGSGRQDVFYGDDGENDFRGLGDFDWFVSSPGGRERYYGGDGDDTVTYFNAPGAITASLRGGATLNGQESGYGSRGWAARDLYIGIENLAGSQFGDSLTGNSGRNRLSGLGGDDILSGLGGTDHLKGGAGNDTIRGGEASDYAYFDGNRGDYTITRTSLTSITVAGPDGTDSLSEVEYLRFGDGQVTIWELGL